MFNLFHRWVNSGSEKLRNLSIITWNQWKCSFSKGKIFDDIYAASLVKYINTILESPFSMLFNDSEHISLIVRYCRKVALDSVRWSKANMRNQGLLFSASSLSHWMSSEKHLKPDFSLLREKEVEQLWDLSNKGFLKIKQCGFQVPGIKIARNKSSLKK